MTNQWCLLWVQEGKLMVCHGFTIQSKSPLLILTVGFVLQMRTLKPRERLTQISTSTAETLILPGRILVGGSWPVSRTWGLWYPSVCVYVCPFRNPGNNPCYSAMPQCIACVDFPDSYLSFQSLKKKNLYKDLSSSIIPEQLLTAFTNSCYFPFDKGAAIK